MHSGSEAREAQSKLHEAEEDIRSMYERMHYVRRAYIKDLELILRDLANMSPVEAMDKAREWLETTRITHTEIPTLSLVQQCQYYKQYPYADPLRPIEELNRDLESHYNPRMDGFWCGSVPETWFSPLGGSKLKQLGNSTN